jgi:nicotinate-nucleotide pyrophosphorylase (carboxylating)
MELQVQKNSEDVAPSIDWGRADHLIDLALSEDLDMIGDVTTLSVVPEDAEISAVLYCKEDNMVLAGLPIAERVFKVVEPLLEFTPLCKEGDICNKGDVLAKITGPARGILTAERTALNFLQRLCGVATASHKYAVELEGTNTVILDTRKTTPGYRNLEKYAVAIGGASNHRIGLYDRVMIKDNHRELAALEGPGGITRSVERARKAYPDLEIEVEADSLDEVKEAAEAGVEYILLDSMSNEMMAEAVKIVAGRAKLEASGNVTIERLKGIAATGVDFVSSGALTHSVKSCDISLDIRG